MTKRWSSCVSDLTLDKKLASKRRRAARLPPDTDKDEEDGKPAQDKPQETT